VNYVTSHFEGIQVFTTLGVFASTLDKLPKNWGIRHITLESLVEAVAEVTNRPVREFAIEAVRIITAFAHFQLDIAADDLGNREVLIISHFNISVQLAHLCEATSLLSILPLKLYEEVVRLIGVFPNYTSCEAEVTTT
jgi:hypothetical protein